ncbi:excalibur calcium-binding domain-containing protein [Streptomyces sp. NPDC047079]|uniref:excalibur calcium-binding domain-containing protein n=1 Tax=Streptomyces sp. NPDC047079 TaxID=3154607 RepID=UPI0033E030B9
MTATKTVRATVTAQANTGSGGSDGSGSSDSSGSSGSGSSGSGGGSSVYYENCTAARAAGDTPLYAGDPGYRAGLDRDSDGVACE